MEMLTTFLLFVVAIVIVAYLILVESTDWIGRAEIIEKRTPRLWAAMNNRATRLVLIVIALAMIARVMETINNGAEPVHVIFQPPRVPTVEAKSPPPESPISLRRRTFKVADEVVKYVESRRETHPPYAYPDSRDPNPSDERKKMIQACQAYDRDTEAYYAAHFRDRMVGIVREYSAKGVRTGFLENSLSQRPPVIGMPGSFIEGTANDELYQFRELVYHVDANDNLITF